MNWDRGPARVQEVGVVADVGMCADFFNYCSDAVEAHYRAKVVEL
jgi:hypothetical protein